MPTPQEEFQNAVLRILETVMFENWIRFYFLTEKLDAPVEEGAEKPLFVAIPEQGMQRIKELYPDLLPLAPAHGRDRVRQHHLPDPYAAVQRLGTDAREPAGPELHGVRQLARTVRPVVFHGPGEGTGHPHGRAARRR